MQYMIDNSPGAIDWKADDFVQRTLQNCKNLLMCRKGEVPYDRLRGLDPAIYDMNMAQLREELLPELDRVMEWEPDAEVVDAEATLMENGGLRIRVTLEI